MTFFNFKIYICSHIYRDELIINAVKMIAVKTNLKLKINKKSIILTNGRLSENESEKICQRGKKDFQRKVFIFSIYDLSTKSSSFKVFLSCRKPTRALK